MGGGDLNSKKSWHPNTMKNQERVWKAEQAALEEKKRIVELQRERAEEHDRAQLNSLIRNHDTTTSGNENRLSWMYDKPDRKIDQEEYLLGKSIDKNSEPEKSEQNAIPAVARRVVGSSMLASAGDSQVDLARKIREDPLLLIKERERAARAALLNNPLQRRRLTELLRKEHDERKESKVKKPKKKDNNLDDILAAKLTALSGQKGISLSNLLNSDDSSSDSSSGGKKIVKKKKKKKHEKGSQKSKKSKKKRRQSSDDDSDSSANKKESNKKGKKSSNSLPKSEPGPSKKRSSSEIDSGDDINRKRLKKDTSEAVRNEKYGRSYERTDESGIYRSRTFQDFDREEKGSHKRESGKQSGLSEREKAARLAEMAAAGAAREEQRGRRVAQQRAADAAADTPARRAPCPAVHSQARSLPDSLQSRIHSTRHYIQRDKRHMNEHFARR